MKWGSDIYIKGMALKTKGCFGSSDRPLET